MFEIVPLPCFTTLHRDKGRKSSLSLSYEKASGRPYCCSAGTQGANGVVALEQVEQRLERLAARRGEVGVALDDQAGIVARRLQQLGMGREIGQPHVGQAARACAEKPAGAPPAQVLVG